MNLLTQIGSLVCRVPSFLEPALPRHRETGTTFFHRSQSALAIVAAGLWRGAAVANCSTRSILRRYCELG
jgi:hypothetical protein